MIPSWGVERILQVTKNPGNRGRCDRNPDVVGIFQLGGFRDQNPKYKKGKPRKLNPGNENALHFFS